MVDWIQAVPDERLHVSAVSLGEMQAGIEITREQDPEKAEAIERWADRVAGAYEVLPMDAETFRIWARLMHQRSDTLYVAIAAGNKTRTIEAFDAEGFLFDGGVRFTPEAIADLILKAEAAGTKPQWAIEGAESQIACDLAWATWTNRGSFTTAAGVTPKLWLESAVFVGCDGAWRIRFFHSSPATGGN